MEETPTKDDLLAEVETLRAELNRLQPIAKEFDELLYMVSHDFNAPLRGIHSLTNWLVKEHGQTLDEDGKKMIMLMDERVLKLVHMIEAVLTLSRIGRAEDNPEDLDLAKMVQEVFEMLNPGGQAKLEIVGALPVIRCEASRMEDLFSYLLDNALYFMGDAGSEGLVRVACDDEGPQWRFSIADNGPGIKSQYLERIFKMFHTLEVPKDPKRVGAGLTLARKIVEKRGGKIWMDSEVGKGSTCFFTWPKD